jgi:hypothetical protein
MKHDSLLGTGATTTLLKTGPDHSGTRDRLQLCDGIERHVEFGPERHLGNATHRQGPGWVIKLGCGEPFAESPVYPEQRTSSDRPVWSVSCKTGSGGFHSITSSASDSNVGPCDEQRPAARQQPPAYDGCGRARFGPTLSSPDLPHLPSGRTSTLGSVMMGVLMVVKASRPGRDAGKGVCWDTRDAHDDQGGNRDDNSKRHDQFLPQTAWLDLIPNATPLIT